MQSTLQIGWSEIEITPPQLPVAIAGQFPARVSEGVKDPLYATVCVLDSGKDCAIFVVCDLVSIPDELRDSVRKHIDGPIPSEKIIIHATHTHTGPEVRGKAPLGGITTSSSDGVDLGVVPYDTYTKWLAERLAEAITHAWNSRTPGGIAYGMDYAVVGRNRRWVNIAGTSTMYGLTPEAGEGFRHIEGYEDHSLNLLATYNPEKKLTGLIVNVPSPSQEEEHGLRLSADFWCETRAALRKRLGENIFILPQCSAAGDLTPHLIFDRKANDRMLELHGRTAREEIATRITDAVGRILPCLESTIETTPCLHHHTAILDLPVNRLTQKDADNAAAQAESFRQQYEQERAKLEADPTLKEQPRWYMRVTQAYRRMHWNLGVVSRFEQQKTRPTSPAEVHVIRLGDIAFATNPFEYYLDFGIQIKVRTPAVQTFLVQLAGGGTYVPSPRSVIGGGYGSVPASNPIGPEGGQILADHTIAKLRDLFEEDSST